MDLRHLQKKLLLKDIDNLPLVNYEPAALQEWDTGWHITYRILNPETGVLERKKLRFEKIRKRLGSDTNARKYAKIYCSAINEKLESGWNPYMEGKNAKSFHKLLDTVKTFLNEKELDMKNGVFSPESMRTYKSQTEVFSRWITKRNESIYVGAFNKTMALDYMDYLYTERQLSPRSWNNYLNFSRNFWNWLVEKNYCTENVFQQIKSKTNKEKERTIIPEDWSKKIIQYFRDNQPSMEIVCGLIYNSFLRPAEICRTQIKDIQIAKNAIYLPATKTKNKKARWCLLPPHLIELLVNLGIDRYPMDYYLFSSGLKPGKTQLYTRKIDKYWHKMREVINLPMEYQLYSYRDTGITDLKKQGHSNLFISSITGHLNSDEIETYTHAPDPKALGYIIENSRRL